MNTEQLPHTIKAPRIEYIDLAKGICILLVVLFHLKEMYKVHSCLDVYLYSTLIPLYFFLSGYVFKTYGGWNEFILKKIKRLIIPFAFFYITTSVLIPITAHHFFGINFRSGQDWRLIYAFLTYGSFPNIPLWFLWGLFILNIIFFALHRTFRNDIILGGMCILLCFILGHTFKLPASLNKTFQGLPFFYFGYVVHNHNIMSHIKGKYAFPITVAMFVSIGMIGESMFDITLKMLMSAFGVMSLLIICRKFKHVPYVSYVGRYSIMVLVTHEPMIRLLNVFHVHNIYICFLIIAISYFAIIPFMRKFMPHVTAQK